MSVEKTQKELLSERRRMSILDAARTVFSSHGYAVATVDDVAVEAGIAKGTLYLYYRSKEEIYLAALTQDMHALSDESRQEMDRFESLRDKIRAFLQVRLGYWKTHEDFLRIYLAEYGSMFTKPRPLPRELHELFRENLRHMTTLVEAAIARGEIRSVAAGPLASVILDLSRGLMERRLLGWNELLPEEEAGFTIDILWSGIDCKSSGD